MLTHMATSSDGNFVCFTWSGALPSRVYLSTSRSFRFTVLCQPAHAGSVHTSANNIQGFFRGACRVTRLTESRVVPPPDPVFVPQGRAPVFEAFLYLTSARAFLAILALPHRAMSSPQRALKRTPPKHPQICPQTHPQRALKHVLECTLIVPSNAPTMRPQCAFKRACNAPSQDRR